MKKLLFLLILVPVFSFGQTKEEVLLCLAMQSNNFMSDSEAENALDKILNTIGASKNFVLTPCSEINNAAATSYKGIRYILYDKEFMRSINSRTNNWSSLAIFAHEVGHHINGHALDLTMYAGGVVEAKSLANKRKQELEADEFAGFVMARLGASLDNALAFTRVFKEKDDTYDTHPSKSKRVNAVRKGFKKAGGNSSLSNTNNSPTEYTRNNTNISVEEYINRGMEKIRTNNYKGAISDFTAAIRIKPDYDIAYFQRAYAKSRLGQSFGSISDYSKSIELNPNNLFSYMNRGINYNELGTSRNQIRDHYKAISDFSKVIEINPDFSAAYMNRGVAYYHLKKYNEAINQYSKAIKLDPYDALAYSNRGNSRDQIKQHYQALDDHSKAIKLDPNVAHYYSNRAISKYYLNDLDGACQDWKEAVNLGEENSYLYIKEFCN
jgi:tetratricopeptide (TPR) repeat protein